MASSGCTDATIWMERPAIEHCTCWRRPHGPKRSAEQKALHLSFASSNRLMRVLRAVVGAQSLLVLTREANFAKRRPVGSQLVGDDNRRNETLVTKEFAKQPQRRDLVALGLNENFENLASEISSR
jgi:hypothetical protein